MPSVLPSLRHMRMFKALERPWEAVCRACEAAFLSTCVKWCPSVLTAQAVSSAVSPVQSMRLLASFRRAQGVLGKLFEIEQGKLK